MFFNRTRASASKEAVSYKESGRWKPITWGEMETRVRNLARGISDWVQPEDRVAILSEG